MAKRKVVGIRRKRLPNGRYLQLYVLEGRGPRGGRTVGYILTRKGPLPAAGSASSGSNRPAPSSRPATTRPPVVVKRKQRKRRGGAQFRRR